MALADRIAVMYRGRIVDILPGEAASRDRIGLLMAGSGLEGAGRTASQGATGEPVDD